MVGIILVAVLLLVTGPMIGNWLIARIGLHVPLGILIWVFRWGIWVTLMFFVLALVFSFGPNIQRPFKLFSQGAFVTISGQFVFSEFFRLYLQSSGSYNLFYGAAGGIIGLMTWLYMMGLMILAGAQVNHELGKMN
jgi:membrane protein